MFRTPCAINRLLYSHRNDFWKICVHLILCRLRRRKHQRPIVWIFRHRRSKPIFRGLWIGYCLWQRSSGHHRIAFYDQMGENSILWVCFLGYMDHLHRRCVQWNLICATSVLDSPICSWWSCAGTVVGTCVRRWWDIWIQSCGSEFLWTVW